MIRLILRKDFDTGMEVLGVSLTLVGLGVTILSPPNNMLDWTTGSAFIFSGLLVALGAFFSRSLIGLGMSIAISCFVARTVYYAVSLVEVFNINDPLFTTTSINSIGRPLLYLGLAFITAHLWWANRSTEAPDGKR